MSDVLERATIAAQQQNWSLLNHYLQQLPLGESVTESPVESVPLSDTDLQQVLHWALAVLEGGDFQERWDVAKVFPKLGGRAIAPLVEILENDEAESEVRWYAARILGGFNYPTAIATLVELLKTAEDEDLAAMAADALASLGDSAVAGLTRLLIEPHSRQLAATAIAQIRHPEVITPLLGVVHDPEVSVRVIALEALSSFHDPRIPPVLFDALNDTAAVVRKEAVIGLGLRSELGAELNLLHRLKPLLDDFNQDVCQQAAIALGRLGTDEAADALLQSLQSPTTPVPLTIDLIRVLGWMGTDRALNHLQQILTQGLGECTLEIIRVLGRLEEPTLKLKAAQILLDLNSNHAAAQSPLVKQAMAQAWGNLGATCAIEALLGFLAEPTASVRLHAIAALKNFPTAHRRLEQLATDERLTPALSEGVAIALQEWSAPLEVTSSRR